MSALVRALRGENAIDFTVWWKRGMVVSVVLIVLSIGSLGLRGLNLGVEFTGGVSVEGPSEGVTIDSARSALNAAGFGSARVQILGTGNDTVIRVQTSTEDPAAQEVIREAVATLGAADISEVSVTAVSASWGADVTRQALRAMLFFLAAILVYLTLRLEFRMALGAIVATVHDVLITVGLYSLFQFEVSPGTIVAFLMVLGYSLYDTVVIYDKIKDSEPLVGMTNRLTYAAGASRAMNLVLLRSLNTSVTSLLPVLSLLVVGSLIMGAVTLNQFTIALAIGLVVGTYSSIMVAAPVVVWLKEREPRFRQLKDRLGPGVTGAQGSGGSTPGPAGAGVEAAGVEAASGVSPVTGRVTPVGAIPPRPRKRSGGKPKRR
jgi:preprotein translocase subunit SecF